MNASKPYLLNLSYAPPLLLTLCALFRGAVHWGKHGLGRLRDVIRDLERGFLLCLLFLEIFRLGIHTELWYKLDSVLVESYRVSKLKYCIVIVHMGQVLRK